MFNKHPIFYSCSLHFRSKPKSNEFGSVQSFVDYHATDCSKRFCYFHDKMCTFLGLFLKVEPLRKQKLFDYSHVLTHYYKSAIAMSYNNGRCNLFWMIIIGDDKSDKVNYLNANSTKVQITVRQVPFGCDYKLERWLVWIPTIAFLLLLNSVSPFFFYFSYLLGGVWRACNAKCCCFRVCFPLSFFSVSKSHLWMSYLKETLGVYYE